MLWRGPPLKWGSANSTQALAAASGKLQRTRQPSRPSKPAAAHTSCSSGSQAALASSSGSAQPSP
jgi:hypothetical protein